MTDREFPSTESFGNADRHNDMRNLPAKGIVRIVCFFCLITACAYALDAIITRGLRRINTSAFGAFNKVMSGKVNAEIIINGSSRALSHYDPRIIQRMTGLSSFNLGMNASQIDVELAILKNYLKHNATPKVVIQNLDLFSFWICSVLKQREKGRYMTRGFSCPICTNANFLNLFIKLTQM
jgi:hypothetical protein